MSLLVDSTPLKKNTTIVGTCSIIESKKLYFNNYRYGVMEDSRR